MPVGVCQKYETIDFGPIVGGVYGEYLRVRKECVTGSDGQEAFRFLSALMQGRHTTGAPVFELIPESRLSVSDPIEWWQFWKVFD